MKIKDILLERTSSSLLDRLQSFYRQLATTAVAQQLQTKRRYEMRPELIPTHHGYTDDPTKPEREVERVSHHRFVSERLAKLRLEIKEMIEQLQAGIEGNVQSIVEDFVSKKLKELQGQIEYSIDSSRGRDKVDKIYPRLVRELLKKNNLWRGQ